MGDDRTGSVSGGEWLHINGKQWSEIRRILVFAFIYEGSPTGKKPMEW
jgi:tellurite resistance protein TerA